MTHRSNLIAAGLIIFCAVLFSLFSPWEPSNETWGYWAFARIWAETGRVIVMARGPLYTMYLYLFSFFPYPLSVDIEYISTSCITVFSLFLFATSFFSPPLALIAAILWIPYMQIAEPPTQKLALAASCLAFFIRMQPWTRWQPPLFYALLSAAYLFRPTYIFPLVLFAVTDAFL